MIEILIDNHLHISFVDAHHRANIRRMCDKGCQESGVWQCQQNVLHRIRVVPAVGRGQNPSDRRRILVQVDNELIKQVMVFK